MDLNHLYAQHQISLIRASSATSRTVQIGHETEACAYAHRIKAIQHTLGAHAAAAWCASPVSQAVAR